MDFGITEGVPAHPGINLYALTRGLGREICAVFARSKPIEVINLLFYSLPGAATPEAAGSPAFMEHSWFAVTFPDAARAVHRSAEVKSASLPDGFNPFFISAPLPHGKFSTRRAREVLGWAVEDSLRAFFSGEAEEESQAGSATQTAAAVGQNSELQLHHVMCTYT